MTTRFTRSKYRLGYALSAALASVAALAVLFAAVQARAEIYGRVSGVVSDPSGAVIPGATVALTNVDTGVTSMTTSLTEGTYAFPAVPVGHYSLEIKMVGFASYRETGIVIDVNTVKIIDVHLTVTADIQQVTVNSEPAVEVDTASTQLGEVVTEAQILDAPLNGRDFTALMTLQPGVVPQVTSNVQNGYNSYSVNGARESGNAFLLDGGSIEEGQFNTNAITPNLDSIQEFRMITNTFDAEYGQFNGAIVNVATKAGTDKFHGSAFDFLRNTDFNGRQYFTGAVQTLIQNQYGTTLGGPILPKKLFFFADYQGTRQLQDTSTGQVFVPTNEMRSGNFLPYVQWAEQPANGGVDPFAGKTVNGSYWATQLTNELGYPVTAGEPYYFFAGDQSGSGTTYSHNCASPAECVFPGAVVPQSAISPVGANLLNYVPQLAPNSTYLVNYYLNNSSRTKSNDDEWAIRIDYHHRLGDLSLYFYEDKNSNFNPFGTDALPGFPLQASGTSAVWNLGFVSTISPTKLNEFRLHAMHNGGFQNPGGAGGTSAKQFGFVTDPNAGGLYINTPSLDGVPNVATNEWSTGVSWAQGGNWYTTYQLNDFFTIQAGKHAIKLGGSIYDNQVINKANEFSNGSFGFSGQETGSDVMDLLLGAPSSFAQGVQDPFHMIAFNLGIFGEDSWRARPDLTINYGLRWDVPKPWAEKNGMITNLIPGEQSVEFPNAPRGLVFPGDPGVSKSQAPNRYRTFAPRIGIAYSPAGSPSTAMGRILGKAGTTSVHTGFGVFYTSLEEEMANIDIGATPFGVWYPAAYLPQFAAPFIDRTTGIVHPAAFPAPPVGPPSPAHPNKFDFTAYEPIGGSPGYWHDNTIPYSYQFNLSAQRQITSKDLVQVGYVGSQGHKLPVNTEANPGNQALCLSISTPAEVAPGTNPCAPFGENGIYTAANGTTINGTRGPMGNAFSSDAILRTMGASWYNSLQSSWKHQGKSLTFTLGYTFSKAIDTGSGWAEMLNPVNPGLNHALSAFDTPHNFAADYQWEVPFFKIHRDRFTEGWVVSGITHIASGPPVSMYESDDQSLLGDFGSGGGFGADTPVYTPGKLHLGIPHHAIGQKFLYFNTGLFSQAPLGGNGTSKIRFFHGPMIDNTDLALFKDTKLFESLSLQIRFEMFNAFNHTQYAAPNSGWSGPDPVVTSNFGYVTGAGAPRIGQAALKVRF